MNALIDLFIATWDHPGYRILIGLAGVELTFVVFLIGTLSWQTRRRRHRSTRREELVEHLRELAAADVDDVAKWLGDRGIEASDDLRDALVQLSDTEHVETAHRVWREMEMAEREYEELEASSTRRRMEAIRRLYVFATDRDRDALRSAIDDESSRRFRVIAAQIFARLDVGADVVTALDGVGLDRRTMEQPFYATFRALSREQLGEALQVDLSELDDRVRRILLEVAADRGVEGVGAYLEVMVDHEDLEYRLGAGRIAAAMGDQQGRSLLRRLLEDAVWEVRAQAARGLGRTGTAEDVELLRDASEDPEFWVRENVRWAIESLSQHAPTRLDVASDVDQPVDEREPAPVAADGGTPSASPDEGR